ncbi:MAG: Hsp20/alpha crystallin family protein [Candidatus Omnitrophica bacterium]|nr:Hsp20/alpha crystallin family protein [Candidatus Omnitrophota bacterium]
MKIKHLIPHKDGGERDLQTAEWRDPFYAFQRRVNDVFGNFFDAFDFEPFEAYEKQLRTFQPKMDVSETDKEFTISAEFPGLDEKDIEVVLEGDILTIKGEKKEEREERKKGYYRSERSYGAFQRSLAVPESVNTQGLTAEVKKGVLKIVLPKKPEAQIERKKIEVKGE